MNQLMDANELRQVLAENIKNRRRELQMTQTQLALAVNCTQGKIAQIEAATRALPSDELAVFAEALRTTPAALVTPGNFSPIPA